MATPKKKAERQKKKSTRKAKRETRKAKRDYKHEYKKFQSSTEQKKKRAARNKARRQAIKKGLVKIGDKFDMSHTRNGVVKKKRSVNRGSKSDMPGDKKARGNGSKKRQPKRRKK
jgi:hypothetical protein